MSRRNLTLLLTTFALTLMCYFRTGRNPHSRYVSEGYDALHQWALDQPAEDELVAGALRGMVGVLRRRGDEHSQYIGPRRAEPFRAEMRQEFGGIGVHIRLLGDPPLLTIVGPPEPDSPASEAGIRPQDQILAIDGVMIEELSMEETLQRMRGRVGEPLLLTLLHKGETDPITLTLKRRIINVPSVIGDRRNPDGTWRFLLDRRPEIAYVRIVTFGEKTVAELESTLSEAASRGMRGLALDLRENAGGSLDAAVDVCNLFLPRGVKIVEIRGRRGDLRNQEVASGQGEFQQLPIALLVNRNSASASEIVAACLQDNQRAVVVGERTFGKGTVQRLIPLESGQSLLKLTTASYWRPSGANIHRNPRASEHDAWGVQPDPGCQVPLTEEDRNTYLEVRTARDLATSDDLLASEIDDPALEQALKQL